VQCGHFDSAGRELCHDRSDLVHGQHEIAHLLEGQPTAEGKAGFQFDAVQNDLQIGARQAHAIDAARGRRARLSKSLADLRLPVIGGNS
jgi:hypothetical protein